MKQANYSPDEIIAAAKTLAIADANNANALEAETLLLEAGILTNNDGEIQFTNLHRLPCEIQEVASAALYAYEETRF